MINIRNAKEYIENFLWIRTKEARLIPFKFNKAQTRTYDAMRGQYAAGKPIRIIILKARQIGFSTLAEALLFQRSATRKNVHSLVTAHREDATANLFQMSKRFYDYLPEPVKPMLAASNAQELRFENPDPRTRAENPGLGSRIRCNTAGGSGIGRSDTIQNFHASEFAFWRGNKLDTWLGIAQAVPALPDTMIIIESTPNGFDEFKTIWDEAVAGENDFLPLFFAWFDNPEYAMEVPEGTEFTKAEREIQERFTLTDEQIYWRRWCIKNNCAGNERMFRQEYPATPDEAFLTSGDSVFDNEIVMFMRERAPQPLKVGEFIYEYDGSNVTDIRWRDDPRGCIRIYEEPKARAPYVLGGDTAGEGSDWFSGFVIDNRNGKWCAVLHRQFGEPEYTRQIYCLGMYYNTALIGLEANFSTYPMIKLSELGYPKLYVREHLGKFAGRLTHSLGWITSGNTRPVMIAALVDLFSEHPELFIDYETLGEMLTFVRNGDRPEALSGQHDDLVMGLAVTYAIRSQQRYTSGEAAWSQEGWRKDMIEDYERADEAEKAHLRRIWGKQDEE